MTTSVSDPTSDYFDGHVLRRPLSPPITTEHAFVMNTEELRMLRGWADRGRRDLLRVYLAWISNRVWDERVDVGVLERECRELLSVVK